MTPLLFATAFLFGSPQIGTVGSAPKGNVGAAPSGNVGRAPTGNVGIVPRGNVDRAPSGNVSRTPSNPTPAKKGLPPDAKEKKGDADPNAKAKKKKKGSDAAKKDTVRVTVPLVGFAGVPAGVIHDLEEVRDLLLSIPYDYQGRRAAAVVQIGHAIHYLRHGRSDPDADAMARRLKFGPSTGSSSNADGKLVQAKDRLGRIAARIDAGGYRRKGFALEPIELAIKELDAALKGRAPAKPLK